MDAQNIIVQENGFEEERTVQVNDLGISAIDFGISAINFGITPAQAQQLYNSGLNVTHTFLNNYANLMILDLLISFVNPKLTLFNDLFRHFLQLLCRSQCLACEVRLERLFQKQIDK